MAAGRHIGLANFWYFAAQLLLEPKFASAHQISLKSDDSRLRYSEKMAAVRHLVFLKFGILVTWLVSEHDYASSYRISR